jgi:hypothetical protein
MKHAAPKKGELERTPESLIEEYTRHFRPEAGVPCTVAETNFVIFTTEDYSVPFFLSDGTLAEAPRA